MIIITAIVLFSDIGLLIEFIGFGTDRNQRSDVGDQMSEVGYLRSEIGYIITDF